MAPGERHPQVALWCHHCFTRHDAASSLHSVVISWHLLRRVSIFLNLYLHFWGSRAHVNTVAHLHTCTLALMCRIDMPGHVPHTEWLSILFIQGTSHKLQTASEHAQPCIKVRIHHNKNCNTTATSHGCLKMIMLLCPECIHNNSLRPFWLCLSQAHEYISHTHVPLWRLQMWWTWYPSQGAMTSSCSRATTISS